jgi:parallel beta-helix repeat protein
VISGTGRGIAGTEQTDHIAIDHIEIHDTSHSGVFIRTAAKNGTGRGDWTQRNTRVVENFVHDTGTEGLYIGSSSYDEGADPTIEDVEIVANLVVESGWDGIQVGSAVSDCTIRGNRVLDAATLNRDDQRSGIINNRGSVCDIVANTVVGSAAQGIFVQGNGGNVVVNNEVIQPGRLSPAEGDGVTINRGSNISGSISVLQNTIVAAPRSGIRYRNDAGSDNLVANNLVVACNTPIDVADALVEVAGNVDTVDLDSAGFVDAADSDFRLTPASPGVDAGVAVPIRGDIRGRSRPMGNRFGAGAFEFDPAEEESR